MVIALPPYGITFQEFVAITESKEDLFTEEMVSLMFAILDVNNTKKVNLDNIVCAFNRSAIQINKN